MSISKFKFVSPGVQVAEIDNSQLPRLPDEIGPVIIGRAERGPALRPVKVDSFADFVEIFGNPKAGGEGSDVWRNGGAGLSPTYGVYAAQAYLRNSSPLTFVRLLGKEHPDKTSAAAASAGWTAGNVGSNLRTGGAYGLFVVNNSNSATGSLAAIFYMTTGSMLLRGTDIDASGSAVSGTCGLIQSNAGVWSMEIRNASGATSETISFSFTENNKNYIRKVFNTNPTLTNGDVVSSTKNYFLGETFDRSVTDLALTGNPVGVLLPLLSGSTTQYEQGDQNRSATKAETPWIFSQDLAGQAASFNVQRLFKFKTLDAGEWEQKNLKISITDVKASSDPTQPYGSFTVEVRRAADSDNAKQVVERFSRCSLNPNSNNYVARKVGDSYVTWDYSERRYREYGNYPNQSRYIYIEMNPDVDDATTNESYLPFGFEGPVRFSSFILRSGSTGEIQNSSLAATSNVFVTGATEAADAVVSTQGPFGSVYFTTSSYATDTLLTCSMEFPKVPLRSNSLQGKLASPKDAYFGVDTSMTTSTRFDKSYQDVVRAIGPGSLDATGDASSAAQERSFTFTLEDLTRYTGSAAATTTLTPLAGTTATSDVYYYSGSRAQGNSLSITSSNTWNSVLDAGFDSFTVPLHGGFDGLDITEIEPFRNSTWDANSGETNSYSYNSVKIAIDSCADPEVVECNLMSIPGITNTSLTEHAIKVCEDRGDALAVIDIEGAYTPASENSNSEESRAGSVSTAVSSLQQRGLNTSYGCAYYPWIQARDSESGKILWVPPSVAAIGTFSSAQKNSELWFAPAGFTRGGLTEGSAGIPVVNVRQRLTSKQRDDLYEVNINPIASFPAEGIVIFGQKTLQTTPSALDRVNVRRLMVFVKKEISRIASRLLFDQNVETTWDRFTGQVNPFLDSIKARLGLADYKVILDESTTTPDLVDRNILYAKIFLKPARAIEFIAIDFVITSTGASFED